MVHLETQAAPFSSRETGGGGGGKSRIFYQRISQVYIKSEYFYSYIGMHRLTSLNEEIEFEMETGQQ